MSWVSSRQVNGERYSIGMFWRFENDKPIKRHAHSSCTRMDGEKENGSYMVSEDWVYKTRSFPELSVLQELVKNSDTFSWDKLDKESCSESHSTVSLDLESTDEKKLLSTWISKASCSRRQLKLRVSSLVCHWHSANPIASPPLCWISLFL